MPSPKLTPVVAALERFFRTNETLADSTNLGAPSTKNLFLRNRLEAAFRAGFEAGEATALGGTRPKVGTRWSGR
jgi:hypothetical protein